MWELVFINFKLKSGELILIYNFNIQRM